jgi:polysaccharide biosynthesis transport protein
MATTPNNKDTGNNSYGNYSYKGDSRYGSYYYGDNGYGYYGYENKDHPNRGISDYVAMFRERIWWLFISLFVWIVAIGFYCFHATPQYTAYSRLQILRQQTKTVEFNEVSDVTIRNLEDFNTELTVLEGITIAQNVEHRLKESEKRDLIAPFVDNDVSNGGIVTPTQILIQNRDITPMRGTLMIVISFTHPNRDISARVANLFAEEYISYRRNKGNEASMKAVDELQSQIDMQGKKVNELEMQMADMKERYNTISLDASTDINQQELLRLTDYATQDKRTLDAANSVWTIVEESKREGKDLCEISDIKNDPRIPNLLQRRTEVNVEVASLGQKYKSKHPRMLDALHRQQEINDELSRAVDSAVAGLYNTLLTAKKNYEDSLKRIGDKQTERIQMEKIRPEYERLKHETEVARQHYDYLYSRKQQTMAMAIEGGESARLVDYASPPIKPSSPKILIDMFIAVILGVTFGIGIILLFILFDDKVKSSFDIEQVLKTNIIGIVPRVLKSKPQTRARLVSNGSNQNSLEAFRSIHSSMKLNDEARNAKVILVTSTIPSEGKSFIATNLALIYAAHGERVIVVDCDLRMPNVAKSLGLDNNKGILTVISGKDKLDDAIQKGVEKGFDVLSTGGKTSNPTTVIGSLEFDQLLHELRLRYDRVFLDSPPLAPVSDSLGLVTKCDGVVYVIRFNTVKRKTAMTCLSKLHESNVPILGAIMNNVAGSQVVYYYSNYYDKSYSSYYTGHKHQDESEKKAIGAEKPENKAEKKNNPA